jgi:hypothetical protein
MFPKETYPDGWLFPDIKVLYRTKRYFKVNIKEERNCFQVQCKMTTKMGRGEIAWKKLLITWMEHFRQFHPIFAWPDSKLQS